MALTDKLHAIGDAIRIKTGSTEKLTLDQMPVEIAKISSGAVGIFLEKIEVTSNPTKMRYKETELFEPDGMVVLATYSNGATMEVTGYTYYPSGPLSVGDTITISYAEGGSSASVNLEINVISAELKIVTWADGTWEEISDMLDAHYAGSINIDDYWSVGDIRRINIGPLESMPPLDDTHVQQTQDFVIAGFNHDELANGSGKAALSIVSITPFESGMMHNGDINGKSWGTFHRRSWCNTILFNGLDSDLQNIVKEVEKKSTKNNTITVDKVWIPSQAEYNKNNKEYDKSNAYLYFELNDACVVYGDYCNTSTKNYVWTRSKNDYGSYISALPGVSFNGNNGGYGSEFDIHIAVGMCL